MWQWIHVLLFRLLYKKKLNDLQLFNLKKSELLFKSNQNGDQEVIIINVVFVSYLLSCIKLYNYLIIVVIYHKEI